MSLKMDLKYMINICERELKRDEVREIDSALHQYLEECTEENIAAIVSPTYYEIRKNYKCKMDTVQDYGDFWNEVTKYYFYTKCVFYEKRWGIKNAREKFPFFRDLMKEYAEKLLDSIYGNTFQARLIAQHEEMGGMHAVIEAMTKKLEERDVDSCIRLLICKFFDKFKNNYYAIQYIAASCFLIYRPDLQESIYQEYISCHYDIDELSPTNIGLFAILTLHLKRNRKGAL